GLVINLMNLRTGATRQITDGPTDTSPRWSPDGTKIAFLDFAANDRGDVRDPVDGESVPTGNDQVASIVNNPLGEVKVLDLEAGTVSELGIEVPASSNAVSWGPGSDVVLAERVLA